MKTADIFPNYLEKQWAAQRTGCVIVDGAEGPTADLATSFAASPYHCGRGTVTWRAKDWDDVVTFAAQLTPAILAEIGFGDRYEGQIIIDLRYCEGQPATPVSLHLADFLEPLAEDCAVFVLVRPEAARSVQGTLCSLEPLCLHGEGEAPRPRVIGFERRDEHELS